MHKYTIIAAAVCVAALPITAAGQPSVSDLLDEFAKTHDKLKSYIVKNECTNVNDNFFSDTNKRLNGRWETTDLSEFRTDGERSYVNKLQWGDATVAARGLPKEHAIYISFLWDGERYFRSSYSAGTFYTGDSSDDSVVINRKDGQDGGIELTCHGDELNDYEGRERMDVFLRNALQRGERVSLLDKMEKVGGSDCYVIEAVIKDRGKQKLWLDPHHGYHIAKSESRQVGGLSSDGDSYPEGLTIYSSMEVLRFENIDGVWVPMEAKIQSGRITRGGDYFKNKTHVKRTEFTLDPDHDALGSFLPSDIRNGAEVIFSDVAHISYRWQDGELVPEIDEHVVTALDEMTERIIAERTIVDTNTTTAPLAPAAVTVAELLERYRATQIRLRSFIARSQNKVEYTGTMRQSEVEEKSTSEFMCDEDRVCYRYRFWGGLVRTIDKPGYKSFLWDGKNFIQYTQSAEPGNSRVFIRNDDDRKKQMVATEYKGSGLLGICGGDYERIDSVLSKADRISLRVEPEQVAQSECYVIDAATRRGKYTVWIDPAHGYNIARIEVRRSKGDLVYDGQTAKSTMSFTLQNVRFEENKNVWVPMEADIEQNKDGQSTGWHHKRIQMILNPDHDALHSFVADDIPDGTKVVFPGLHNKTGYKWQNGKPVSEVK